MVSNSTADEEIARRGQELYECRIRPLVEPACVGQFVAVNVESGEFDVAPTDVEAIRRSQARHPDALVYLLRVGQPTAYKLGGRRRAGAP